MRIKYIPPGPNQLVLDFGFDTDVIEVDVVEQDVFLQGDVHNIRNMLPYLYLDQHEDVAMAEKRFQEGKGYMFTNGTGTGKAQPLTSKIMTPNGWKLMKDIRVNDYVISSTGKKTKVLGVYPQGIKEIYEVIFSDGSKTQCCKEHLWETQTLYQRRKMSGSIKSKAGKPKIRTLLEIQNSINEQHFIPIVLPIELEEIKLEIPPYIMGSLLGDGNFTHNSFPFDVSLRFLSSITTYE